jgi:chromosome segregation ATPase
LEQQITNFQEQLQTQAENHQQLEEQNTINLQSQITQLQSEKNTLSNQINTNHSEIQKLIQEKKELTIQKQILEEKFASLKQTSQEEKNVFNQQITELKDAKLASEKELHQQIKDLNQKIENLTTDLAKEKSEREKEKLAHQQVQIELSNLRNRGTDKEKQLQTQITTLQEKNSSLTLSMEKNNKIHNSQIQDLEKTIQEEKNAELVYQQKISELTVTNQQLIKEANLANNLATPEILQAKERLEFQLKEAITNYHEIKAELSKKEGYLECLISFGKNEKSEERKVLQREINSLKEKFIQAEQTKNNLEEQLIEAKEKLAESKGKLEAKQEEIVRMDELLKNSTQSSSSPSQEENKLIACAKKTRTIQEDLNLFFNG